jgi:LacI family gluconate utilization system Gnt-I transcriptional repressor
MDDSSGLRPQRPSMKQVAAKAGVSAMTVSRALRNPDQVSKSNRIKVENAAKAMGYVLNLQAGSLSSRKSRMVAMLLPSLDNSAFAQTVRGMSGKLEQAGYQLILGYTQYSLLEEEKLIETMLGRQPDAMVLIGANHKKQSTQMLKQSGIPVIELWGLPENPIDTAVGFSNRESAKSMVHYLVDKGYEHIVFLGGTTANDFRGEARFEGYREAMLEHNLAPLGLNVGGRDNSPVSWMHGLEAYHLLQAVNPRPDAVFCVSDILAAATLAVCTRHGMSVPKDLAIAGHGDYEFSQITNPSLTTVAVHSLEMGARAAEVLLERLEPNCDGPPPPSQKQIDLGFEIVSRESA